MRFTAHTKASDTPVLPPVYSTTEPPGRRRPFASAASTMASAMRSFMLPVGFSYSSLRRILALPSGTTCWSGTSLVRPMKSSTVTLLGSGYFAYGAPRGATLARGYTVRALLCPQSFGGADPRGISRGHVAGDLGDRHEEANRADQDGSTARLHAGEGRDQESGYTEGAQEADGGADERKLRSGCEHEAGDVSGAGSQREADAEFAGALGHGAGDDAIDAQGGQTEPEHGHRGKHQAEDALLVIDPGDRVIGRLEFAHGQILVERHHGGADTVDETGRRDTGGAHGDFGEVPGFLGDRLVELVGSHRDRIGIDRFDVADDSDDLSPFDGLATGLGDAPAERIFAREETTGHGLIDDEDFRGRERVAGVEGAPIEQAGADSFEI